MADDFYITSSEVKDLCLKVIERTPVIARNDGTPYHVTIKKESKNKTTRQRNYFHKCLEVIAKSGMGDYEGNSVREVQENAKMKFKYLAGIRGLIPMRNIKIGGADIPYPASSEDLTVTQYGSLIDLVLEEMAVMGLTPPPGRMFGYDL